MRAHITIHSFTITPNPVPSPWDPHYTHLFSICLDSLHISYKCGSTASDLCVWLSVHATASLKVHSGWIMCQCGSPSWLNDTRPMCITMIAFLLFPLDWFFLVLAYHEESCTSVHMPVGSFSIPLSIHLAVYHNSLVSCCCFEQLLFVSHGK